MTNNLIIRSIQLHICLLFDSHLIESIRVDIHNNTFDLICDLHGRGVLDSIAYRALMDRLSIAFIQGGL